MLTAPVFIIGAFVATLIGGLIGFRYQDKLHIVLGFTAGVLVSVVVLDLIPEIFEITHSTGIPIEYPMLMVIAGFLLFHTIEKVFLIHNAQEGEYVTHLHPMVGKISALALAGHTFLDGLAIGIGFQIDPALGTLIALSVIAHGFSDGLNTVSLMLLHGNSRKEAFQFLLIDAAAPVLGGLSTLFFTLSEKSLVMYLGFFAGFLLYIGASEILPEAHSQKSSFVTILATFVGVLFVILATQFLGHLE